MAAKLKVIRTAIGFHDAYVAAPSRKAALAAWGSGKDLFARGMAEEVTDPALTEAALAAPGTVVRRSRGTAAEQMAALPERPSRRKPEASSAHRISPKLPAPKPDRAALDTADRALEAAKREHAAARAAIKAREAALAEERRTIEREGRAVLARLEAERDDAAARYERAMTAWRR